MLVEKKKSRMTEIPMASLADIAFLLLIFFLVTTTIDVDRGIGLTLPAKGEQTEVRTKNITNLLINAQGEVLLDDEIVPVNEIHRIIERKLEENPKLIVSVKTDRETQYDTYIQALDELKVANATRISIAEPEK
ncbi:biopolymer transporter ExbD [candidate division KSB1 bacterium]|nr:biopolymer transporter ExbD [candidate division KSB1 bacterium]NIR71029.1 biopolymer transporter ExbD [candidate division KSB1 bacterium]NIS26114.1 biopolymer transporter ExbD [candidate division KSB1 bacterium]NIT72908.1 biopolymer transporter ExbD [candidate division KSB1 bacterium]NIU26753.1 biopolymer transporter ExbD [candidate division KSB1 bacterium]